jgi:hypothetical protein
MTGGLWHTIVTCEAEPVPHLAGTCLELHPESRILSLCNVDDRRGQECEELSDSDQD